jgi:hypothetical protein
MREADFLWRFFEEATMNMCPTSGASLLATRAPPVGSLRETQDFAGSPVSAIDRSAISDGRRASSAAADPLPGEQEPKRPRAVSGREAGMLLAAFAFDYDGTLAQDGAVDEKTVAALRRLEASGRKLLMVTGRELPDLRRAFPAIDLFDVIVAENGGLLFMPATGEERPLSAPPAPEFVAALRARGVSPLSVGRSIVATWQPNETKVLEVIRELGLERQIIFNKGAVMCLPAGVNKASGLAAALETLGLSPLNVVAVGDAENDHAFLSVCGCAVAVANAIETLKDEADIVTAAARGAGVAELVDRLLGGEDLAANIRRHDLPLGRDAEGRMVALRPDDAVLIAGASGIGKTRLASALIERMQAAGFQVCVIDPEGDYQGLERTVALGDPNRAPLAQEALDVAAKPSASLVVNLLGVELADRPAFFAKLLSGFAELRSAVGRPHWIVADEAHHLAPAESASSGIALPHRMPGMLLITAEPGRLGRAALEAINVVVAVGDKAPEAIESLCRALGSTPPEGIPVPGDDEAIAWTCGAEAPRAVRIEGPAREHRRHVRKYAKGTLGEDKSFYFRGPAEALNLRAQNLMVFLQIADGVDDATWRFHLLRHDYSRWLRQSIGDADMAAEIEAVERDGADAAASRWSVHEIIRRRYTAPADG